jgi:hypothetical protein
MCVLETTACCLHAARLVKEGALLFTQLAACFLAYCCRAVLHIAHGGRAGRAAVITHYVTRYSGCLNVPGAAVVYKPGNGATQVAIDRHIEPRHVVHAGNVRLCRRMHTYRQLLHYHMHAAGQDAYAHALYKGLRALQGNEPAQYYFCSAHELGRRRHVLTQLMLQWAKQHMCAHGAHAHAHGHFCNLHKLAAAAEAHYGALAAPGARPANASAAYAGYAAAACCRPAAAGRAAAPATYHYHLLAVWRLPSFAVAGYFAPAPSNCCHDLTIYDEKKLKKLTFAALFAPALVYLVHHYTRAHGHYRHLIAVPYLLYLVLYRPYDVAHKVLAGVGRYVYQAVGR